MNPQFMHSGIMDPPVTADFQEIIRNWWDTVNVKSKEKGRHKRND